MPRTIARYLLAEIAGPFAITLVIATFVLLMQQLVRLTELLVNKRVPFGEVALLVAYILPRFLAYTIPIAILIAALVAFGRLSGDSEIVAFKASGVSMGALLAPALLPAAAATAATAALTLYALPHGNLALERLLYEMARTRATVALRDGTFTDDFGDLVVYAREVDDKAGELRGILLRDEKSLDLPLTAVAERGRVFAEEDRRRVFLRLENGEIHAAEPGADRYQLLRFASYDVNLALGGAFEVRPAENREIEEYTVSELRARMKEEAAEGARPKARVELHQRLALPFSCLVFTLLAAPLAAAGSPRSGRSTGFLLGVAVTILFFVMMRGAAALALGERLPAAVAMWAPNALLGAAGLYLLRLASREERLAPPAWAASALARLAARLRGRGA